MSFFIRQKIFLIFFAYFRALKRVQALVAEYEKVKKEENERRTTYKNEKNELEQEIAKLEERVHASPDANTEENEKMKQIEEQYKLIADRLQKQRLVMVRKILLYFFEKKNF